jgi:hypothetical protein
MHKHMNSLHAQAQSNRIVRQSQNGGACSQPGNNGSLVVTVVGRCPGCTTAAISLHPLAFSRLAPLSQKAIPIRCRQVRAFSVLHAKRELLWWRLRGAF